MKIIFGCSPEIQTTALHTGRDKTIRISSATPTKVPSFNSHKCLLYCKFKHYFFCCDQELVQ